MQHTWTIDADVLPEEEDAIRHAKVFELHRADRHADLFGESDGRALVAHVRAVGEIVVAVHAGQQLIHIRRFERSSSRRVEHDGFRIELLQLVSDFGERIGPFDRNNILVAGHIPSHRVGQTPFLFQSIV